MLFEALAVIILTANVLGVVVDDELYRTVNTLANLATVMLLVWHQRHVRKQIEPEVKDTAAMVKRKLGDRQHNEPSDYDGPERRKDCT